MPFLQIIYLRTHPNASTTLTTSVLTNSVKILVISLIAYAKVEK